MLNRRTGKTVPRVRISASPLHYVLCLRFESINSNHYYVEHSSKLEVRLFDHNSGLVVSTRRYIPWKVVYTEIFKTKSEAYKRELQIKSYKGGNAFKKLINSVSG